MTPQTYSRAVHAYQRKSDENMSPLQIVVELYRGMIKQTKEAKKQYQAGHLDIMTDHIVKAFNIIEVLQAHVDLEQGGEDAAFLNRFYTVIFSALSRATSKPDPVAEFDSIAEYIQQVHDRWYVMAYPKVSETPEAKEAQQG